jgi:hypothetical protein
MAAAPTDEREVEEVTEEANTIEELCEPRA